MFLTKMINLYSDGFLEKNLYLIIFYLLITIFYYLIEVGGITYVVSNLSNINKNIIIKSLILLSLLVSINYFKGFRKRKS